MPEVAESHLSHLQQNLFNNASWFYILAVAIILLSVTYLGLSRYGQIKLGRTTPNPILAMSRGLPCFSQQVWELG